MNNNKFNKAKANQQASALRVNPEQLKIDLMHLFDTCAPSPVNSTNEERVAYLENQRLKALVMRVLG